MQQAALARHARSPAYPQEKTVASYPSHGSYVYDASLELEIRRPASTAERAIELTQDYGGYLSSSQSWWLDGDEQFSLELMVPAANFDGLYAELQRLGTVTREHVYGRWDGSGDGWSVYSHITLQLRSKTSDWPAISLGNWRPLDTLREAWNVSAVHLRLPVRLADLGDGGGRPVRAAWAGRAQAVSEIASVISTAYQPPVNPLSRQNKPSVVSLACKQHQPKNTLKEENP